MQRLTSGKFEQVLKKDRLRAQLQNYLLEHPDEPNSSFNSNINNASTTSSNPDTSQDRSTLGESLKTVPAEDEEDGEEMYEEEGSEEEEEESEEEEEEENDDEEMEDIDKGEWETVPTHRETNK